jgi:peptide/nickel transport system permease protein
MATAALDVTKQAESESRAVSLVKPEGQWEIVFRRFRKHRLAVLSMVVLIVIFVASLLAPIIAPYPRDDINITRRFVPAMTADANGNLHIGGTDHLGRDVFTRLLYGARVTLTVALIVATLSTLIGMTIGAISGYYRGTIDTLLMRFLDFMAAIPTFPILLILTSILLTDPKLLPFPPALVLWVQNVMLLQTPKEAAQVLIIITVLVAFGWTGIARLMRGMVLSIRERDFIEASRALGSANNRILLRHVVPNGMAPIIVAFTQELAGAFATETVLSFLGFGIQEPTATWGNMMKVAEENIFENRLLPVIVGIPILLCSLAFNFVGDGLRDALDPRLKM